MVAVWKIGLLAALYFVQGLPFGFQTKTLPVYLRQNGLSLSSISFLGLLSLPWAIKLVWAPFVDTYYIQSVGKRRTWILAATGSLTIFTILASVSEGNITAVLCCLFFMNLAASIQDVSVDALAIELLADDETGYGNSAQVIGFKMGMLTSGGVLASFAATGDTVDWSLLFVYMAVLCAIVWVVMLLVPEPHSSDTLKSSTNHADEGTQPSWLDVVRKLRQLLQQPSTRALVLFLATYKVGEVMADSMFKPFLVDLGYTAGQIGLWSGSIGMSFSILGSLLGGWLASNWALERALYWSLLARIVPQAGRFLLSVSPASENQVASIMALESITGGVVTTIVFTMMMLQANEAIGASHYTMLATVEVIGKSGASIFSGVVAHSLGYPWFFAITTVLCALSLSTIPAPPSNKQH